jgi:hypothetical protein
MQKIIKFIEKHGLIIILMLMILATCTENMSKRMSEKKLNRQLDSIKTEIKLTRQELQKEIKVEGLKSEKRMIQSTDRKILDVNRQAEIDKELKQIDK